MNAPKSPNTPTGRVKMCLAALVSVAVLVLVDPSHADETSDLCDEAARIAANETGVPLPVLRSITRTETGRTRAGVLAPWPWTVNMEGQGIWFASLDEAKAYVFRHFKRGARSFDIGCFQINYRWHNEGFRSIDEMFDPLANARYAARFLKSLSAETESWTKAAGAYHSRTPVHARRYEARYSEILASLDAQSLPSVRNKTRVSSRPPIPLQDSGQPSGRLGSLMPDETGTGRAFIFLGPRGRG